MVRNYSRSIQKTEYVISSAALSGADVVLGHPVWFTIYEEMNALSTAQGLCDACLFVPAIPEVGIGVSSPGLVLLQFLIPRNNIDRKRFRKCTIMEGSKRGSI